MKDLLPWIVAIVLVLVVFLVSRAKEKSESDPGISLFGGDPPDPGRRPRDNSGEEPPGPGAPS
jgi:hypothetical protein